MRIPVRMAALSGRATDVVQRALRVRLPIDGEGAWVITHCPDADASAAERDLGVRFRPLDESIADTYRRLSGSGRLAPRWAGRLRSATAT